MHQMLALLNTTAAAPPAQPSPQPREAKPSLHPEPFPPSIERYDGDPSTCRFFLSLCSVTFEVQPHSFSRIHDNPSDRESSRVGYSRVGQAICHVTRPRVLQRRSARSMTTIHLSHHHHFWLLFWSSNIGQQHHSASPQRGGTHAAGAHPPHSRGMFHVQ